jgi:hypothetical protein
LAYLYNFSLFYQRNLLLGWQCINIDLILSIFLLYKKKIKGIYLLKMNSKTNHSIFHSAALLHSINSFQNPIGQHFHLSLDPLIEKSSLMIANVGQKGKWNVKEHSLYI